MLHKVCLNMCIEKYDTSKYCITVGQKADKISRAVFQKEASKAYRELDDNQKSSTTETRVLSRREVKRPGTVIFESIRSKVCPGH